MKKSLGRFGPLGAVLLIGIVGVSGGCATRRYARNQVNQSAADLTAKMDEQDKTLQGGIDQNAGQVSELNSVTREHGQQLNTLNTQVKQTDDKASQAMNVGQGAQKSATQAQSQVSALDERFVNRNHYSSLQEEKIPFKFGGATLNKDQYATLDNIAQQVKSNPDAVIVLEGRTDNVGDANYNVTLGERRLEAVAHYLIVEKGVPIQQVYKESFGKDQPIAPNNTKEGRAENRSVVLRVMGPEGGSSQPMMSQTGGEPSQR